MSAARLPLPIGFFFATLTFFLATLNNVARTAIFATKMLQKNVARNFKNRAIVAMSMLQGICKMAKMLQRPNSQIFRYLSDVNIH